MSLRRSLLIYCVKTVFRTYLIRVIRRRISETAALFAAGASGAGDVFSIGYRGELTMTLDSTKPLIRPCIEPLRSGFPNTIASLMLADLWVVNLALAPVVEFLKLFIVENKSALMLFRTLTPVCFPRGTWVMGQDVTKQSHNRL